MYEARQGVRGYPHEQMSRSLYAKPKGAAQKSRQKSRQESRQRRRYHTTPTVPRHRLRAILRPLSPTPPSGHPYAGKSLAALSGYGTLADRSAVSFAIAFYSILYTTAQNTAFYSIWPCDHRGDDGGHGPLRCLMGHHGVPVTAHVSQLVRSTQ